MTAEGRFVALHPEVREKEDPIAIAHDALRHAGLAPQDWETISNYADKRTGMRHLTLRQHVAGLECANCIAVCNIDRRGRVVSLSYTAHAGQAPGTTPKLTAREALASALSFWNASLPAAAAAAEKSDVRELYHATEGLSHHDVEIRLEVLATQRDEATLVWEVSIETPDPYYHMYQVCICAETGEVLQLHDLVNWVRVPCFSGPFEGRN